MRSVNAGRGNSWAAQEFPSVRAMFAARRESAKSATCFELPVPNIASTVAAFPNGAGSRSEEHPMTISRQSGFSRRIRRTRRRDCASALAVTVQVLTTITSASSGPAARRLPAACSLPSTAAESNWFSLQPSVAMWYGPIMSYFLRARARVL